MSFRSPYPDIEIPDVPLPQYVLQGAVHRTHHPALIDGESGRTITYPQLAERVRHAARSLTQRGYRKGHVFAFYSPNLPEYAVALLAAMMMGGTATAINPLASIEELATHLRETSAQALLTASPFLARAQRAASGTAVREIFTLDSAPEGIPFVELYESVMMPEEPATKELIDPQRDLALLPHENAPAQTHRSCVASLCRMETRCPIETGDVLLGVLPFFRNDGFAMLAHALRHGASVVTLPRFELHQFLGAIERHRATRAPLIPPIISLLADHPAVELYDLSSLRELQTHCAALNEPAARRCEARLGCVIRQHEQFQP
ncbi:MAG: AMP-binding protein [Blastocatellia bacterium]|nr:AMP-binding protein [Blastocatellia bacterium]